MSLTILVNWHFLVNIYHFSHAAGRHRKRMLVDWPHLFI